MSSLNSDTAAVLRWAKRSAVASQRAALSVQDLLCGLYALRAESAVDAAVSDALNYRAVPAWPEEVVSLHSAASKVEESDRKFPLEEAVRVAVDLAHREDPTLALRSLVPALLDLADPLVAKLRGANRAPGGAASPGDAPAGVVDRLEALLEAIARLKLRLSEAVLGQETAITMLADAYFRAQLDPTPRGPRGIFTFMGPPGVGKTLLAERFAEELSALHGDTVFQRFDMGNFSTPQSHEQLFGVEAFYKNSRPGTLTGYVSEHPRAVVLLDEIEKASLTTLHALLSAFDRGEAMDKALDRSVSFREVWFVLTTNLGQDLFSAPNRSGCLAAAGAPTELLLDILTADPSGGDTTEMAGPNRQGLPPELVSRLAKGGVAVFNRLETGHYLQLVRQGLVRAAGTEPIPTVRVDDDVALLFLLGLVPKIDARRVVARSAEWSTDVVRSAHEACRAELRTARPSRFDIALKSGGDARAFLAEHQGRVRLRIALIDDHDHLEAPLARELKGVGAELRRFAPGDGIAGDIRRWRADAVLLDISIGEPRLSARIDRGGALLESLRAAIPGIPVTVFSEHTGDREVFLQVLGQILERGGARRFIPCRLGGGDEVAEDDFVGRVRDLVEELRHERLLARFVREHKRVAVRTRYRWDKAAQCLHGEVYVAREELIVGSSDQRAAFKFSGIPSERLDDVVGLKRAKGRLAQVRRWLADPAELDAFGTSPPRGFLLAGPPGTGKTLLARALAGEAGLPFLALAASELQSRWVGGTEGHIREAFQRAREYAPSILFIDELDAIARRRQATDPQHANSALTQLLSCMDGFQRGDRSVFVLAATNRPDELDPAILRPGRFDETIAIDLPNAEARRSFFERALARIGLDIRTDGAPDIARLARSTTGCSPAELDRIVREAVYLAAAANRRAVTNVDLLEASRLVRYGAESREMELREDDRRNTAYHESGHALAHLALFPGVPIDHLTIVPNERGALGFLATQSDDARHSLTRTAIRDQLVVALAGREAERLVAGNDAVTTGASSDLQYATRRAWAAVAEWGLSDEWGPLALSGLPEARRTALEAEASTIARQWLSEARKRAAQLLEDHRPHLDALASALLEHESLDGPAIADLLAPLAVVRQTM